MRSWRSGRILSIDPGLKTYIGGGVTMEWLEFGMDKILMAGLVGITFLGFMFLIFIYLKT